MIPQINNRLHSCNLQLRTHLDMVQSLIDHLRGPTPQACATKSEEAHSNGALGTLEKYVTDNERFSNQLDSGLRELADLLGYQNNEVGGLARAHFG